MGSWADLEMLEMGVRGAASHDYFCPQFDQETGWGGGGWGGYSPKNGKKLFRVEFSDQRWEMQPR